MAWKLTAAPYCLLFLQLALALHIEDARPQRSMLDLDEESTLAKLRFEAGDPACGRFQFHYVCYDGPPSSHTPSTQEPAAFIEDAQVLPKDYPQDPSDCGSLGTTKYRCVPPMETTVNTPASEEVAAVEQDAQVLPEDPSDCGQLGNLCPTGIYGRCVPPMKTPIKTPAPEEVSPVGPSVQEGYQPAQSNCGPLSKHKYRCVPPMH